MKQWRGIVTLATFTALIVFWFGVAASQHICTESIHKDEPGTAIDLHVVYTGTGGTIRDVVLTGNPPGCGTPGITVVGGNEIHFTWPEPCVDSCEVVEYQFTVGFPCETVQPPYTIEWTYEPRPTLSQWVLIVLAVSVAGFFVWQMMRRRKAAVRV
jgi:hypothetical protein